MLFESAEHVENHATAATKMEIMDAELAGRGFECQKFLLSADAYGIPQDIRKLFAVYLRTD